MTLTEFICPDCGGGVAFYSRRRTFTEKYLLPLLLLRPFRCADCFQRSYWFIATPAREPRDLQTSDPAGGAQRVA
jgi:hypothetical protein